MSIRAGRKSFTFSISGAALAFIALVFIIYYGTTTDFVLGGVLDAGKNQRDGRTAEIRVPAGVRRFRHESGCFADVALAASGSSVGPNAVDALLHAVAVVNAGAYAVLRVIYYSFGASFLYGTWAQTVALLLSCFTILFGSTMAVREQHFKRRLAYSTISNLSYMLMGAALMTPDGMTGSLSHLVIHGVIKITLFYCAGAILIKTGKEYVQDLRGYSRIMPATCGIFLLGSIALVGTPPLAGFVSKWNLLTAASATELPMGTVAIVCLIISAILTAIYLFTAALPMYFRPLNADQAQLAGQKLDPSWMMLVPMGILCALMIGLGLWSQPLVTFLRNISASVIF